MIKLLLFKKHSLTTLFLLFCVTTEWAAVPPPTITSFAPISGAVGTVVTIAGTNFNTTAANNIVFFGATRAAVSAATSTSLSVTVPIGATYQPISVTNFTTGLTAYSVMPYTTTFTGGGAFASGSFADKADFATVSNPFGLSIGDLDGDGKPDVAVTNDGSNSLSVLRNTSTSGLVSFAAKIDYTTGTRPFSVSIGDLDGDGKPDLAVANYTSNTVSVFRNTSTVGNISFAAKVDYATSANPNSISMGDFDGDGKPDLVTADYGNSTVSVLLNTSTVGNISFAAKTDFTTGIGSCNVFVGDLDGDGKPDLAVANYGAYNVSVLKNTSTVGNISFAAKADFAVGYKPYSVSIGDLDADGKADIVAANFGDNNISVLKNTSTVGNISFAAQVNYTTGSYPYSVSIGDLDGDGKPDLAVANWGDYNVSVIRNISTVGSVSLATQVTYAMGAGPHSMSMGDLDGDGILDLAGANYSGNTVSVLRNTNIPPAITSFAPTNGTTGTTVTITGTGFTGTTSVSFGGIAAASFTVVSPTSITAVVAGGASGNVSVTTARGSASLAGLTYTPPPAPTITSFTPTSGATGTTITITGTTLTGATAISFGGTMATSFTVVSATNITAVVAAGISGSVSVTTPGGTASLAGFTFVPAPTITSLTPTSGAKGATVTITGTNFTGATAISFGGTTATSFTVVSATSITAVVATGTSGSVRVTTPGGTASLAGFTFIPAPTIISFTPTSCAKGTTVTITGTNLTGATAISFGGATATSFTVVSATSITAVVAAGTSGSVSVTTPGGTASLAGFTFIPTPTITSFTPTSGTLGTTITITGTNFTGATSVSFGGTTATSFTVVSATSITAVVAAGTSGSVSVTTPCGTATLAGFIYLLPPAPTITSFSPASGTTGTIVSIAGTDLGGATNVNFGGTAALSFTVVSATNITAVIAGGASGNISITTPSGTTSLTGFTFIPPPTITSFAPTSGAVGTVVTIAGTNFNTTAVNNIVFFGATRAAVSAATSTSLSVTVPIGATYQPISVTDFTTGLTAYSVMPFTTTFIGGGAFALGSFADKADFVTASNPFGLSIGDLDGDGKPDVAVTNDGSNSLSVLRNTSASGLVSFAAKIDYTTGTRPFSVSIGDLDGDGKPDLAVANYTSNTVSVFRNTSTVGNISFAAKVDYATSANPNSISMGDFDGDGKPDLVTADYSNSTVSVLLNTSTVGNISFAAKTDFTTGIGSCNVFVGDLDGDGKPDLAVANYGAYNVSLLKNTSTVGNISFAAKADFAVGYKPYSVSIGDLDADGKADIVAANFGDDNISVLKNTSTVGNISFATQVNYTTGSHPYSVSIGDLDGDGKPDLAVANWGDNTVSVIRNISTVGSVSLAKQVTYAMGAGPHSMSMGDLDGDGILDLAGANYSDNTVSVLRNTNILPAITSFAPTNGTTGTIVTITGTGFIGTTTVSFGGIAAASFTVVSASSITAVVAEGASGSVYVTTQEGNTTLDGFTFAEPPTSIRDAILAGYSVYPNPAGDYITIKSPITSASQITVFDIWGRIVLETKVVNEQVNLQSLVPGVYNLMIDKYNYKLIKN